MRSLNAASLRNYVTNPFSGSTTFTTQTLALLRYRFFSIERNWESYYTPIYIPMFIIILKIYRPLAWCHCVSLIPNGNLLGGFKQYLKFSLIPLSVRTICKRSLFCSACFVSRFNFNMYFNLLTRVYCCCLLLFTCIEQITM